MKWPKSGFSIGRQTSGGGGLNHLSSSSHSYTLAKKRSSGQFSRYAKLAKIEVFGCFAYGMQNSSAVYPDLDGGLEKKIV